MEDFELILTFAGGLGAALLFGYVTHRLGLSPIVGYLLAGVAIGPYTPGLIANAELAEQLAEVGVILLMFGVGLQFHVEELWAVRRVAVPGAAAGITVATLLGALAAHAFGWNWTASVVFGLTLSVASTVVLVRVLSDSRQLHTSSGHIAVGWLVVEDLFTVLALVLMPTIVARGVTAEGIAGAIALTVAKIVALVLASVFAGKRLIPQLLDRVAATRSRELFTLTVLVLALGIAVGAARVFDVSMALGAFLAGMVVGRSDYSQRAASDALPMRDAFAVLFFVSVGMLLNPAALLDDPWTLLAALAVVLLARPLIAFVMIRLMRYPFRVALSVSVALSQVGEFSFILSSLGKQLGVFTAGATNTIVAVSIISIVLNPILYRSVKPVERWAMARPWLWRIINGAAAAAIEPPPSGSPASRHRAVVVGYGPTGRTVTRLLRENGVEPVVIELNMDTVRQLKDQSIAAIYGDASHRDTLKAAGVAASAVLVLTSADIAHTEEVIRTARQLNPQIRVLARTTHLREVTALAGAGADDIFSGEGEVALAFTVAILSRLGATAEQIDRERSRVHDELFGAHRA